MPSKPEVDAPVRMLPPVQAAIIKQLSDMLMQLDAEAYILKVKRATIRKELEAARCG